MAADASTSLLLCHTCLRRHPADHYRHRPSGKVRQDRCRQCRREYMVAYREAKRSGRIAAFAGRMGRITSARRALAATASLNIHFGGPQGLAAAIKDHFAHCPPGSHRAWAVLRTLLQLTVVCDARPLDQVSDDELEAALKQQSG